MIAFLVCDDDDKVEKGGNLRRQSGGQPHVFNILLASGAAAPFPNL